jgi:phosphoribosylaminoimidazole carboxylase PurE protein
MKSRVAIVMGSRTDLQCMLAAQKILSEFKVNSDTLIISAHRTPEEMVQFAKTAHEKYQVIIAGAGGAAHLPGMIASLTHLPVIGVPVTVTSLQGLDALLSIVQMPKGVPVATVAIDNAENAGLLAARILAIGDSRLSQKLTTYQNARQTNEIHQLSQGFRAVKWQSHCIALKQAAEVSRIKTSRQPDPKI